MGIHWTTWVHVAWCLSSWWVASQGVLTQQISYTQCMVLSSWEAAARVLNLPSCQLPSVMCTSCQGLTSDKSGNITELDLHASELKGPLPLNWAALTSIRKLNLSSTGLQGPLPIEWAALTALTELDLSNNSLNGTLPEAWQALTGLVDLNLSFNRLLTGIFPVAWSALTRLTQLWLSANALTGTLPPQWGSFTRLQGIYLCGNKVQGSLPNEWSSLGSLNIMLTHSNRLSGTIPEQWPGALLNLSMIQLDNNQLSGPLPPNWFTGLPALQWFSASRNHLTGNIPALPSNALLEVLDVQNNTMTGQIPSVGPQTAPRLAALRIGTNRFSGPFPQLPPNIVYLDARHNVLTGSISALPASIKYFNVAQNSITNASSLYAPNITFISLAENAFMQRLPRPLSPSVKMVNVSYNKFLGPIPASWADTECVVMDMSNNHLNGPLAANLTAAYLIASYNSLSGTLPATWPEVPPIQVLDLQNNSLHGNLPPAWFQKGSMARLKFLGLANNQLGGDVPLQWIENGANRTMLVLGSNMWRQMQRHGLKTWMSNEYKYWLETVCTNPHLFRILPDFVNNAAVRGLTNVVQDDIQGLARDAAMSLNAVQSNDIRVAAILGQMFTAWSSVAEDPYIASLQSRKDNLSLASLCSNGSYALPLVLALWGLVFACVLVVLAVYFYLRPYVQNVADSRRLRGLPRWVVSLHVNRSRTRVQVLTHLVHLGCMAVYWGDIITDLLILVSVWGTNWVCYALLISVVSHYVYSAHVVGYRWVMFKEVSICTCVLLFPVAIAAIPILDTLAFAHEAGLHVEWLSSVLRAKLNMERYHEGRALVETFMESVPGCIIQSIVFALGNNPNRPLYVDGKVFLLSILFSGLRTVFTAGTILWEALFDPDGLGPYCLKLLLGEGLFQEPEPQSQQHSTSLAVMAARPREVMRPSRPSRPSSQQARPSRRQDLAASGLDEL